MYRVSRRALIQWHCYLCWRVFKKVLFLHLATNGNTTFQLIALLSPCEFFLFSPCSHLEIKFFRRWRSCEGAGSHTTLLHLNYWTSTLVRDSNSKLQGRLHVEIATRVADTMCLTIHVCCLKKRLTEKVFDRREYSTRFLHTLNPHQFRNESRHIISLFTIVETHLYITQRSRVMSSG